MKKSILLSAFFVPVFASAQVATVPPVTTPTTQQSAPSTKLEAFSSKTGIVVVKGFTTVGKIYGQLGTVSVDAREFRNASNPKQVEFGVSFEVKESGRLERESRSFVDQDEIDSLINGIDYISKITKSVTSMNDFEAEYRTKGDFAITVFSESSGSLGLAISSGRIGKTRAFFKPADLDQMRSLLVEAKKQIELAKANLRQ